MTHSLDLMYQSLSPTFSNMLCASVDSFWDENGGYGGGIGQIGNVITTYACVCLQYIAGLSGLNLRRNDIYKFLRQRKLKNCAFQVHENGEYDTRSTFCAIATASLLNILTKELTEGVDQYIASCQCYDGGIAGKPNLESHAAYSFCGLATLCILGKHEVINLDKFKKWCTNRVMKTEFGFQGRPNKLVDSCYSYWIGATIYLLNKLDILSNDDCKRILSWSKMYLLLIAQTEFGFRDKPGKDPDLYHTCYSLSSLALTDEVLGQACKLSPINPLHILTQYTVDRGKQVLQLDKSFNVEM
ncbi:protein farnesyltransferase subunit beta [Babesia microti strain RI]|uniref:Protein farnesyltransferase subunit beta n=1 Tax=Babesia microti (strain RI) TaxID=1133968 RepID=A0A1N6LYA2_BABMR|nr:protein farnesyltransferase subunit beta [Babesia microti strain RI]SIO73847.1 protein farnesyltransferase subunit beta [Babesia microti strain RI]|eukprot:XP_012650357.2 protein farnesyltransferase subunit beta [Babesia microti strain RI]